MELLFKQLKQRFPLRYFYGKMCLKELHRTAILSYLCEVLLALRQGG